MKHRAATLALVAIGSLAPLAASGCAGEEAKLRRASTKLAKAIEDGDGEALEARTLAGQRGRLDRARLLEAESRHALAERIADPQAVRSSARMRMGDSDVVEAMMETSGHWVFSSDPSDFYGQATPREALRSFVRASRLGRWDVLLRLAPRRYRMGLSPEDLRLAWTEGDEAKLLAERRDRLAERLDGAIRADAHQAIMALGDHRFARLEREQGRWVVVDF